MMIMSRLTLGSHCGSDKLLETSFRLFVTVQLQYTMTDLSHASQCLSSFVKINVQWKLESC